jgi:hypothetical protein
MLHEFTSTKCAKYILKVSSQIPCRAACCDARHKIRRASRALLMKMNGTTTGNSDRIPVPFHVARGTHTSILVPFPGSD